MTATSDVRCLELSGRSAEAFEHLTFRGLAPLLRRAGADGRVLALGAVGDGGPIGLALAEISEDGAAAELRSLAVRSEHRRRGVATRLLAAVERALAVARVRSVAASFPDDRESGEDVLEPRDESGLGLLRGSADTPHQIQHLTETGRKKARDTVTILAGAQRLHGRMQGDQ